MSVLYGVRWQVTPHTFTSPYGTFFPEFGAWSGPGSHFDSMGTVLDFSDFFWPMKYTQFAPRFGLAYRLKNPDVIVRAGGGIFYDTDLASLADPVNLSPLSSWQFVPGSPSFAPVPVTSSSSESSLPKVWEWRTSVEKRIREQSFISLRVFMH